MQNKTGSQRPQMGVAWGPRSTVKPPKIFHRETLGMPHIQTMVDLPLLIGPVMALMSVVSEMAFFSLGVSNPGRVSGL